MGIFSKIKKLGKHLTGQFVTGGAYKFYDYKKHQDKKAAKAKIKAAADDVKYKADQEARLSDAMGPRMRARQARRNKEVLGS